MNVDEIVTKAKARLAEVEAEAAKLRAIIAAAEGKPAEAQPASPVVIWHPAPTMPWPQTDQFPFWPYHDRVTYTGNNTVADTVYSPGPTIGSAIRFS